VIENNTIAGNADGASTSRLGAGDVTGTMIGNTIGYLTERAGGVRLDSAPARRRRADRSRSSPRTAPRHLGGVG
jgi:hypothetical protein